MDIMTDKIVLWNNDGTVIGSRHPDDSVRKILAGVAHAMKVTQLNYIILGSKDTEGELRNYDPEK